MKFVHSCAALVCLGMLGGCFGGGQDSAPKDGGDGTLPTAAANIPQSGAAHKFNPWMNRTLPNLQGLSSDGQNIVVRMGGKEQNIQTEIAHRPHWREEVYPVVFGDPKAPHEILVLLDFSNPKSEQLWKALQSAQKSLSPEQAKIVLFGNNTEKYGTDLTGLAIWLSYSRKAQAMPYMDYALHRWNEVKQGQKKARGKALEFTNEYDATLLPSDMPIHYAYFSRLNPPLASAEEPTVAEYCYDAGNINQFQTAQVAQFYGVRSLPAVIIDGNVLSNPSAQEILAALK